MTLNTNKNKFTKYFWPSREPYLTENQTCSHLFVSDTLETTWQFCGWKRFGRHLIQKPPKP